MLRLKKLSILTMLALFALPPMPLKSEGGYFSSSLDIEPSETQLSILTTLYARADLLHQDIASFHQELQRFNRIDEEGATTLSLQAGELNNIPTPHRYVVNEEAIIRWEGNEVAAVILLTRRGHLRDGLLLRRRITATGVRSIEQPGRIDFFIDEVHPTGQMSLVNFRFPAEVGAIDARELMQTIAGEQQVPQVWLRQPDRQIRVLREYIRGLELIRYRLDSVFRLDQQRRQQEVDRALDNAL